MATIPLIFTSNNILAGGGEAGFFFKCSGLPGSETILLELDGSTTGYMRLTLKPTGVVQAYQAFLGVTANKALNSTTVVAGAWYWVGFAWGSPGPVTGLCMAGQVWGPGGATDGCQYNNNTSSNVGTTTVNCRLGWGVQIASGYADAPNTWELSKLFVLTNSTGNVGTGCGSGSFVPASPPTSDMSASGMTALYLCRNPVGSSLCTDSSGNGYDLTAGPNGMVVVSDGPY